MKCKIRFFVILMFFCLITLNTANAYTAYINIYIVDLDTNTAAESDPIKLVDHSSSPIKWKLAGTGCTPTAYQDNIAIGEYGNGDTIITGSAATLTAGSSCTLYLEVDEVKVGSYYYGSCLTNYATTHTACTTCANAGSTCPTYSTADNGYQGTFQSIGSSGSGDNCANDEDFGRCSDEIVTQLDEGAVTEFTFTFTA